MKVKRTYLPVVLMISSLGGCTGVYAEVAGSKLTSATFSPSSGPDQELSGATSVGVNLGLELGSTRQRFAIGYAADSLSFDGGSASGGASSSRYDFTIIHVAARMKLRLGLGFDAGSGGTATFAGIKRKDTSTAGAMAGLDVSYFLTWKTAIHVLVGARVMTNGLPGGSMTGTGVTGRVTISHTFGDVRPDQELIVPLDDATDITGLIEAGANAMGCVTKDTYRSSTMAHVLVACPGGHRVDFVQIAEGLMVTCEHEQSRSACEAAATSIARSTRKLLSPPAARAPAASPAPEPTPTPVAPAAEPAGATAIEPAQPATPSP